MKSGKETTTVTISKETMLELKRRAIEKDKRYSDYLEELIRNAWGTNNSKKRDKKQSDGINATL